MDVPPRDLLERLKRNDAEATATWVADYKDDLYRFMRHLTRQVESAEDLTQQTFVRAFKALPSFEGRCSMRTWLHRIAFREYVRWRKRQKLFSPLTTLLKEPKDDTGRVDDAEQLLWALDQLPAPLKEAFLMFEVQELSIEEIAEICQAPIGTVKSRLHSARLRLQTLLEGSFKEVCYEFPR